MIKGAHDLTVDDRGVVFDLCHEVCFGPSSNDGDFNSVLAGLYNAPLLKGVVEGIATVRKSPEEPGAKPLPIDHGRRLIQTGKTGDGAGR